MRKEGFLVKWEEEEEELGLGFFWFLVLGENGDGWSGGDIEGVGM